MNGRQTPANGRAMIRMMSAARQAHEHDTLYPQCMRARNDKEMRAVCFLVRNYYLQYMGSDTIMQRSEGRKMREWYRQVILAQEGGGP